MSAIPELILIAAVARNGVIGRDNALPWRLRADLQHFRAATMGHPILMGRKTWESLGRPLPGRRNLVLTRDPSFTAEGATCFDSLEAALAGIADCDKVFVIGGAELYRQVLDRADRLMLTEIDADIDGDAHFPPVDWSKFEEIARQAGQADEHNQFDHAFVEYRRRR